MNCGSDGRRNIQVALVVDKVQRLLDDQRVDSLQVEKALQKEAPIDRYLEDIKAIGEGGKPHASTIAKHSTKGKRDKVKFSLYN